MKIDHLLNKGRIADILSALCASNTTTDISSLSESIKLNALLTTLQLSIDSFDNLLANNSPVLRTVKGHAFETVFKRLLTSIGINAIDIGGDQNIDLIVNDITLQLKTPYSAGTKNDIVQFKTHKTHGAKSENESMEYYHVSEEFPDYLVGLISYEPFNIIFISREELPRHPKSSNHILSPFALNWVEHEGLNNFQRIGIASFIPDTSLFLPKEVQDELLPQTCKQLNLTTSVILDTILLKSNFRIWDMNIRGFARETAIHQLFNSHKISIYEPIEIGRERADKSDFALQEKSGEYKFFQVKGASVNYCVFNGELSSVSVETQLTRGRVNDHPTQSRLYLKSDFDFLIICLDPPLSRLFDIETNNEKGLYWRFFCVPTTELSLHPVLSNRLKSVQTFRINEIGQYEIGSDFLEKY
jgi:hypothetical protein